MRNASAFDLTTSRCYLPQLLISGLIVFAAGSCLLVADDAVAQTYYRLQLKQGGKYLDATNCSDQVALHPGSTYADGACQLWRFVPVGGGWNRLQLKQNGKYLDAVNCSDQVALHPGSTYAEGACQLWRFVPADGGWNRLQLKQNGKYLDAVNCSDQVALHPGSTYAEGACQLWRFAAAGAAGAAGAAAATAGPPGVVKVDEQCHFYANRAVQQFKLSQGRRECAVRPDGRWQANYDAHYNWCLTAAQNARAAEQGARDDWLTRCGAQTKFD